MCVDAYPVSDYPIPPILPVLPSKPSTDTHLRPDLLKSKLFALCDRGTDVPDVIALAPTAKELAECAPWLEGQDGNELWPAHVRATLADIARRLGHGV